MFRNVIVTIEDDKLIVTCQETGKVAVVTKLADNRFRYDGLR